MNTNISVSPSRRRRTSSRLTILVHNQHERLTSCLMALHNVGDGVLALGIKGNVNGTSLVVDGGDDCFQVRGRQFTPLAICHVEHSRVFSARFVKWPLYFNQGPAAEMWSVVLQGGKICYIICHNPGDPRHTNHLPRTRIRHFISGNS